MASCLYLSLSVLFSMLFMIIWKLLAWLCLSLILTASSSICLVCSSSFSRPSWMSLASWAMSLSTLSALSLFVLSCPSCSFNSRSVIPWFLRRTLRLSMTFVYFWASKISSKRFLRAAGSLMGHNDSSWWQKMTASRMAGDTPSLSGTSLDSSPTRLEMTRRSPLFRSSKLPSFAFWVLVFFFTWRRMLRVTT